MAKVPIAVLWNARDKNLSVHPDPARVTWRKNGERDTAVWTLLGADDGVELLKPAFKYGPPDGPFGKLERLTPQKWEGSDLALKNKMYKYEVELSNGAKLDPALLDEEDPG